MSTKESEVLAPAENRMLAVVMLTGLASFARQLGQVRKAKALELLAEMVESGKKIDDHMKQLVVRLRENNYDWEGAINRIKENSKW